MPWVEFTGPFNWDPPARRGASTHAFSAGLKRLVPKACADEAVAAGRAKAIKRPFGETGEEPEPGSMAQPVPETASEPEA
jgi:hypothetical protein